MRNRLTASQVPTPNAKLEYAVDDIQSKSKYKFQSNAGISKTNPLVRQWRPKSILLVVLNMLGTAMVSSTESSLSSYSHLLSEYFRLHSISKSVLQTGVCVVFVRNIKNHWRPSLAFRLWRCAFHFNAHTLLDDVNAIEAQTYMRRLSDSNEIKFLATHTEKKNGKNICCCQKSSVGCWSWSTECKQCYVRLWLDRESIICYHIVCPFVVSAHSTQLWTSRKHCVVK